VRSERGLDLENVVGCFGLAFLKTVGNVEVAFVEFYVCGNACDVAVHFIGENGELTSKKKGKLLADNGIFAVDKNLVLKIVIVKLESNNERLGGFVKFVVDAEKSSKNFGVDGLVEIGVALEKISADTLVALFVNKIDYV